MDPVSLLIIALILGSGGSGDGGGGGTTSPDGSKGHVARTHVASPMDLIARATQPAAAAWPPFFVDVGELPAVADALARWAGLESSGNASLPDSVLGERGLLQAGKQTVSEGGMTQADWDVYASPELMPNQVARISDNYAQWLFTRAAKHLPGNTANMIPTDRVWFAYQYHQRPADFTQWGQLPTTSAASASAYLLGRAHLNNDAQLVKRVTASNVVAWGTPDSPMAPMA